MQFHWEHYLHLNPDVIASAKSAGAGAGEHLSENANARKAVAVDHWKTIGRAQGRLCNKAQLYFVGEFGQELCLYMPYIWYLVCAGLWFDNTVSTYRGMRDLYWFLPREKVIERPDARVWMPPHAACTPIDSLDSRSDFSALDLRFWRPLPLLALSWLPSHCTAWSTLVQPQWHLRPEERFAIVHNKCNLEWSSASVNCIPSPTLLCVLQTLVEAGFRVVYIRPRGTRVAHERGFVDDHNTLQDTDDYASIAAAPPFLQRAVTLFDDLLSRMPASVSYNLLKLLLYARAERFVHVQGGNSQFAAMFGGRQVVYHVKGPEFDASRGANAYTGWFQRLSPTRALELRVATSARELEAAVKHLVT
jgi:hypothetical protein